MSASFGTLVVVSWKNKVGLRLLSMLGGEASEAAADVPAVLLGLLAELRKLLGQLSEVWRRGRRG